MKQALALVFALIALTAPAVFASEAELSEIERPVDAQAQEEEEDTATLGQVEAEDQPVVLEVIRHEDN